MENRIEQLERELKETSEKLAATKEQLRLQSRRARQLVAACSSKAQEKEREMQMLRVLKDGQLQSIIRKLLHFESLLRQEQKKIVDIVQQKDSLIGEQANELEQLRQANRKLLMAANKDDHVADYVLQQPDKSKLAKLNSGAAKCHQHQQTRVKDESVEDKENVSSRYRGNPEETPLVTKMVRRFELPNAKKPEVPKKPTRLLNQWKSESGINSVECALVDVNNVDCKLDPSAEVSIYRSDSGSDSLSSTGSRKTVSRADSVNDHGYFTLEKRKPVQQLMDSPRSGRDGAVDVPDDMDLRHNFEEFHLDSLEEEEHFYELGKEMSSHADSTLLIETPPLSLTESPIRSPGTSLDRSSGDGAEWSQSYSTPPPSTPPPTILSASDCTSLNVTGSMLLPQLGDATPTAVQFDRFLDVSGLTQKSILTPSRLLSNHKNMLKPKDVKHRSKVKAIVLGNCRSMGSDDSAIINHHHHHHSTSQVRYYVEPFL